MSNKNHVFSKIMYVLCIPFMVLWTIVTGDGGASARFVNDAAKENSQVGEPDFKNMTR